MSEQTVVASNVLTTEDVEFLTALANELKTQDRHATAKPVLFQILENKPFIGIDPDFGVGEVLVLGDEGESFFDDDVEGAREWLLDGVDWTDEALKQIQKASTLKELDDFLEESERFSHTLTGYVREETYKGAFLTKKALLEHVKHNAHHYTDPKPYATYVWRNPELERLLTIIEKFATVEEVPQ